MYIKSLQSCVSLCKPMDCSCQAPLSMGFSRQEYWSRLPFSSPGDLPDPGIKPESPALQVDFLHLSHQGCSICLFALPWWLSDKESATNAGGLGLIPGSGRSPGEGNGNPPQYSCQENPRGQRSMAGCSPQGHKESDMTDRLNWTELNTCQGLP